MFTISRFLKDFSLSVACTSFVTALSSFAYRAIRYIVEKCQSVEKVEQIAQRAMLKSQMNSAFPLPQAEEEKRAAIKIQRACRLYLRRVVLRKMESEDSKAKAAVKIQSACRGHLARLQVKNVSKHLLSYALFAQAKRHLDSSENLSSLPRATSGATPVYLPQDADIVLKSCGAHRAKERLEKMRQALALCEKNAYIHLVVPQARVCGNFIIEARLPIATDGLKEQICLYMENSSRFTAAVQEFAGFMAQATLLDTSGNYPNPYGIDTEACYGRYDNLPLYLDRDEGKIGLVDLETFYLPAHRMLGAELALLICLELVRLFPQHLNEIIASVRNFYPPIEGLRQKMQKEQERVLEFFDEVYTSHLRFLLGKGITNADAQKVFEPTEERKNAITKVLCEAVNQKSVFWTGRTCISEVFERKCPAIIDLITTFLKDSLVANRQHVQQSTLSCDQLTIVRTLQFSDSTPLYGKLQQRIAQELLVLNLGNEDFTGQLAGIVTQTVFKELEKGGEIAYYSPKAYCSKGSARYVYQQCIFC